MKVATLVKKHREERNLSQRELADLVGLETPQYISNIECNRCAPSVYVARKLCVLLDIPDEKMKKALKVDFVSKLNYRWSK